MTVCRWSRPATSIHDRAQWVHDHLPNVGDGACCDPRCLRRTHVSGWRIRRRWGRLATAALDLAAPFGCRRRASARVAAPSRHDVDPRPRGAPDGERDRRPGPCAADCCWQRAGRLGACASLRGGSGHRDSLRAGTAAHGPRNSQIRLRPRGAERQAPCGHGRASVARCCRSRTSSRSWTTGRSSTRSRRSQRRILVRQAAPARPTSRRRCRPRLGGLLNDDARAARRWLLTDPMARSQTGPRDR